MSRQKLRPPAIALSLLLLSSCSVGRVDTAKRVAPPMPELSWVFDCLRTNRFALVAAHRGQKDPEAAENSIAASEETFRKGIRILEIDVGKSADGVPMLLHDETLDRTTTGSGILADKTYRELRQLYLKRPSGELTDERIPTLDEALVLARRGGAILMIDRKRSITWDELVQHIRSARMERQVILIAYTLSESRALMNLAPEMMISTGVANDRESASLLRQQNPRMLRFTGTSEPSDALIAALDDARVEAITGTLGKPGERLDDQYRERKDKAAYARLAARGVTLISSDRPVDAWDSLKDEKRDGTYCLTGDRR